MLMFPKTRTVNIISPLKNYLLILMLLTLSYLQFFYEKPPFPTRIREHSFVTGIVNKSERTAGEHEDLIKVDPQVALVKDLVTSNVEDSTINFYAVSTNLVTAKNKGPISGTPVVSVKIGDHNYYGLCDLGSSASVFLFHFIKRS